jgi:hypothetical protein
MLKRMTLGALKGGLLGVLIALLLVFGLKVTATGAALAYVLAVATGAVAGLVTGKPIWAPDAKIEAGIKGFFGALLGAGILFALRKWLPLTVDFSAFNAGQGALGELPAAYVPIVAGVLGLVFELDNTGQKPDQSAPQKRVAGSRTEQRRVAEADADPMLEAEMDPERARRRHER